MSELGPPSGAVCCLLCRGFVSVRAGNLEKLKLHVESDHDVFYEHDILFAINFLDEHEKEIIIEKVLPRMKSLLENTKQKEPPKPKLHIEKRLLELAEGSARDNGEAKKFKNNTSYNRDSPNTIDTEDTTQIEVSDDEEVRGVPEVAMGRSMIQDQHQTVDQDFTTCDICHQSIRNSVLDFHKKTHLADARTSTSGCELCGKLVPIVNMWKHKSRCSAANRTNMPIKQERIDPASMNRDEARNFQCRICFADFDHLVGLKMHTTEEHSLDLEDVEQMLDETSQSNSVSERNIIEKTEHNEGDETIDERQPNALYPSSFKCNYCDSVFTKRNNARRHEKRSHPELVRHL